MDVGQVHEIVIVGGGICGLATALALHRKGISSIVVEKAENLRATGVALGIHANGWRALDQLGVGSKLRQTAMPIQAFREVSIENISLNEKPIRNGDFRCIKRSILMETLAKDLPVGTIHFGCEIIHVQIDPLTSHTILQLRDGRLIKAKVVIGCDGVNSVIANFIGLPPPNPLSVSAVQGFTNYAQGHSFSPEMVTIRKDALTGRIPLDDKHVYWFVARQRKPEDSIIYKEASKIKSSILQSVRGFPREVTEMIENSDVDSVTLTDIKYRAPWELLKAKFRKGTVIVAGDAMHVMGPFLGQGSSLALEDAIVLARCLAVAKNKHEKGKGYQTQALALDQYVRERRNRLVHISTVTYTLGTSLETSSVFVKLLCIIVMIVFFRNYRLSFARYDCGRL